MAWRKEQAEMNSYKTNERYNNHVTRYNASADVTAS
jgi:hypothetical protein